MLAIILAAQAASLSLEVPIELRAVPLGTVTKEVKAAPKRRCTVWAKSGNGKTQRQCVEYYPRLVIETQMPKVAAPK